MPVLPLLGGFLPPLRREILHSSQILPWNFFAFAILPRNLTQLQEKFYTVCFCTVRCIAEFHPCPPRAGQVLPWNLPLFQREKNQLVPAPLLWYPSSIKTCTRRQNAAGRLGFPPISPRKMSTFREKNLHFHREKCPRFPRNLTHSLYILNN